MGGFTIGAARDYTQKQLGGPCNEVETKTTLGIGNVPFISGNGDRVGLLILNMGSNDLVLSLSPIVGTTGYILIPAGGGFVSFAVDEDYTLPTRQWYGGTLTATTDVYVLEIIRQTRTQ